MNVAEIKRRVKRKFGDESGVQVTDSDIVDWINSAQRNIVLRNENLLEVTATASSTANIQEYSLPSGILIFRALMYKGSGSVAYDPLKGLTFQEFNEYIEGWDSNTSVRGVPVIFTIHGSKFLVYPTPQETISAAFKIYYNREPVLVSVDADVPELPTLYHDVIVDFCLKEAFEMDEDWEAAASKAQEASANTDYLRGRSEWQKEDLYPFITVRIEDL